MNTGIYYRSILCIKCISREINNNTQEKKESQRSNKKQKDLKLQANTQKESIKEARFL